MPLNEPTRAIIRVWTSKENKLYPGDGVGHVSIEIPDINFYASLFPNPRPLAEAIEYKAELKAAKTRAGQEYIKAFSTKPSNYKHSYQQDVTAESGKDANIVICLYSLDIDAMEREFRNLAQNTKGWRLIGSNLLVQILDPLELTKAGQKNVENCASLACKILEGGGIKSLLTKTESAIFFSKTSSVVKPDDVGDLVIKAKFSEIEKNPETIKFRFDSETPLPLPLPSPSRNSLNPCQRLSYFWPIVKTTGIAAIAGASVGSFIGFGAVPGALICGGVAELNRRGYCSRR